MKKRLISAVLVVALLVVAAVFSTQAAKPATTEQHNAVHERADTMSFTGTGSHNAYCPACGEDVTWKALPYNKAFGDGSNGTHYYLGSTINYNDSRLFNPSGSFCLHLNGQTVTGTSTRSICVTAGNTLNVMGQGTISSKGSDQGKGDYYGSAVDLYGTLNLYGGTYTGTGTLPVISLRNNAAAQLNIYDGVTVNTVGTHGVHLAAGTINMYGGEINSNGFNGVQVSGSGKFYQYGGEIYGGKGNVKVTAGQYNMLGGKIYGGSGVAGGANVDISGGSFAINNDAEISGGNATTAGGNIRITSGQLHLMGGTIKGGSTLYGGNIYVNGANATVRMYENNPVVTEGSATNGGNINVATGTLTIDKGEISNGTATENGGNIYMNTGTTLNMSNGTVSIGEKGGAKSGGNMFLNACTANITGGSVTGGKATANGGNFYVVNKAELTLNSTQETALVSSGSANIGGNIYVHTGTITLENGLISGGAATSTGGSIHLDGGMLNLQGGTITGASANQGGNILVNGGSLSFESGMVTNGSAINGNGGNICVQGTGSFGMTGGTVSGGTASGGTNAGNGGNFFLNGGDFEISGATINGGTGTGNGGSIYYIGGKTLTIENSTIDATIEGEGGNAKIGGAIYQYNGTLNLTNTTVQNGKASQNGGNIYVGNVMTMTGGTISSGIANNAPSSGLHSHGGGNIYIPASKSVTITNGTIENGSAPDASGGNIANLGTLNINGTSSVTGGTAMIGGNISSCTATANTTITGATVTGGEATGNTPNELDLGGNTILAFNGKLTINGGTIGDIRSIYTTAITLGGNAQVEKLRIFEYASSDPTLTVKTDYTGTATLLFDEANYKAAYGEALEANFKTEGGFEGTLMLDYISGDYLLFNAQVFGTADKTLVVAGAQIVGETSRWALDGTAAAEAAQDGEYVKLYTDDEIVLADDAIIDFNGKDATVTGEGKLYGMDSTATFTAAGTSTVTGTAQAVATNPVDGTRYVAVTTAEGTTFHPVSVRMKSVTIRPGVAGIYYGAEFKANDIVKENLLQNFGVAVSVYDMPGSDFATDEDTLYTELGKDAFVNGGTTNGVIIETILKEGADDNEARGETPIFANAYITLTDGTVLMADKDAAYSLYDVLAAIYGNEELAAANAEALNRFYTTWETVMSAWNFSLIGQ